MIKPDDIERIVDACKIEEVVGDFVRLTKRGANYIGLCPFHNEKTPSFIVSPVKGIYKCFGCGKAGDAVNFVIEHEHYTYPEALRYLAKKYGIVLVETQPTAEQKKEYDEKEQLYKLHDYAKDFFINQLLHTDEGKNVGLAYFRQRSFTDSTISKFQLGYSPQGKDAFTQSALLKGYSVKELEKSGLTIVKDNHYYLDRFRERVIFPIHNFSGRVIAFGGRVMTAGKTDYAAKYVNSPETDIYHKSNVLYGIYLSKNAIKRNDKCYLVEGYTDVISFHQTGIENVVASSGTSLTVEQIRLIKKLTNNITIIYDGDNAGIKAALRGISLALKQDVNVRVVLLPPEDDPDSFARHHTMEECETYIKEHECDFITFKAKILLADAKTDPIKRAEVINTIAGDVALVNDVIARSEYVHQCSDLFSIPEESFAEAVRKKYYQIVLEQRAKQEENIATIDNTETASVLSDTAKQHPQSLMPQNRAMVAEKALMKILINHGERILTFITEQEEVQYTRLDQYIYDNMAEDAIKLSVPEYAKLYELYAEYAEKYDTNVVKNMCNGVSEDMRATIMNLLEVNMDKKSEGSANGAEARYVDDDTDILSDNVTRVLQLLRLTRLLSRRKYFNDQLQQASESETDVLLMLIQELTQKIAEIETSLGTTYRNNGEYIC